MPLFSDKVCLFCNTRYWSQCLCRPSSRLDMVLRIRFQVGVAQVPSTLQCRISVLGRVSGSHLPLHRHFCLVFIQGRSWGKQTQISLSPLYHCPSELCEHWRTEHRKRTSPWRAPRKASPVLRPFELSQDYSSHFKINPGRSGVYMPTLTKPRWPQPPEWLACSTE